MSVPDLPPQRQAPPGCLVRVRGLFDALRPSEQKVAAYILDHPDEVVQLSVTELARRSGVSDATVVKFSQRLGYSGFQSFKIMLAREQVAHDTRVYGEIDPNDNLATIKAKIFDMHRRALEDTARLVSEEELQRAVATLAGARTIHFGGIGASAFVALDAVHKFLRIGLQCHASLDPHQQISMAALLGPGDAAVGISHSGQTKDTVDFLRVARSSGAVTVGITNGMESPLSRVCDIHLYASSPEPAFRSAATASRLAHLALVDLLFIGVAQQRYDRTLRCLDRTREAVSDRRY